MSRNGKSSRKNRTFHIESLERRELMSVAPWSVDCISDATTEVLANAELVPLAADFTTSPNPRGSVPNDWETNLKLSNAELVDKDGNGLNGIAPVGKEAFVRLRIFTHNLHDWKNYKIRVILDGKERDLGPFNDGAGLLTHEFYKIIPLGKVKAGKHTVTVILNPPGPEWTEENQVHDDNRKEFTFRAVAGQPDVTKLRALNDINIAGVTNIVWNSRSPRNNRPIADGLKSGSFILRPTINFAGYRADELQVQYAVSINGSSKDFKDLDASGQITIDTPGAVGKYTLSLEFVFREIASQEIVGNRQVSHTLYVTMDDPTLTGPLKIQWLKTATKLAEGTSDSVSALTALNNGLYELANQRRWTYAQLTDSATPVGTKGRELELLYGTAKRANCTDMVHAWQHLADVLGVKGVDVLPSDKIVGAHGKGFLSNTGLKAFDGSFGNARLANQQPDRWFFDFHQLGRYSDGGTTILFDPTFKNTYLSLADWTVNVAADSLDPFSRARLRKGETVTAQSARTGDVFNVRCTETISSSGTGNSEYTYSLKKPATAPSKSTRDKPPVDPVPQATLNNGRLAIRGGSDADNVSVSLSGSDVVVTMNGRQKRFAAALVNKIDFNGGQSDDRFENTTAIAAEAHGGKGNDTLIGGSSADVLRGGIGNDWLEGRGGNDALHGDDGNDTMQGGAGDDRLYGASGVDHLDGGTGSDRLEGGAGNDGMYGGDGRDFLFGQAGTDWLYGGFGNDDLYGGLGDDTLYGNEGNDHLDGEDGGDTLYGDHGNDHLVSRDSFVANDELFGGLGTDVFDAPMKEIKQR